MREVIAIISSLKFPFPEVLPSVDFEIFLEDPDTKTVPQDDHEDEDTMKVAISKADGFAQRDTTLLPLRNDPEEHKLTKENSVKYTLRCVRAEEHPTYNLSIRILQGHETVRQILKWRKDVGKIPDGLNIDTLAAVLPVYETVMGAVPWSLLQSGLDGDATRGAINRYNTAYAAAANDAARNVIVNRGVAHYRRYDELDDALNHVVTCILPNKVLARVKRSLRREMRKPQDMGIRAYWGNLCQINIDELPNLPPFQLNQGLGNDEMIDIVLFGCPRSWNKELDRQGFDPYTSTVGTLIATLENIESAEQFDSSTTKTTSSNNKKKSAKAKTDSSGEYYCMLHGKNNTHGTEDCLKLKAETKRLKGDTKTKSTNKDSGKKSSWKKKADTASDKAKSEISALVKKKVKQAVKDLKAAEKKRKSSKDDEDSSVELNAIDNMEAFNYAASKMSLDDDASTETEVSA